MKRIPLTQNKFALVDDADFQKINQHKWSASKRINTYYALRYIGGGRKRPRFCLMHRDILGLQKGDGKHTDHIDGNGLDNQRSNLRVCTQQQNAFNQRAQRGSSRFKGVHWFKRCRIWQANIRHEYRTIHLGYFKNEVDAAEAYDRAAKRLFGNFARLNFAPTINRGQTKRPK